MNVFLAIFTYFAYVFIIVMYTLKVVKYLKLPVHLRWELYPVMLDKRSNYGGSFHEDLGCSTSVHKRFYLRGVTFLLKDYLFLASYFSGRKSYWVALYLSHISFITIICFQIFLFVGAVLEVFSFPVAIISPYTPVRFLYYLTIFAALVSFVTGIIGNVGLYVLRFTQPDLKAYASPQMYLGYIFNILLCLSGLSVWYSIDGDFSQYRAFWTGLIMMTPSRVDFELAVFIILMGLHLIYLPFTRAMHYITRLFAFFLIRWDDEPNKRGCDLEKELIKLQNQKVTWDGPHIRPGGKWTDLVG